MVLYETRTRTTIDESPKTRVPMGLKKLTQSVQFLRSQLADRPHNASASRQRTPKGASMRATRGPVILRLTSCFSITYAR